MERRYNSHQTFFLLWPLKKMASLHYETMPLTCLLRDSEKNSQRPEFWMSIFLDFPVAIIREF